MSRMWSGRTCRRCRADIEPGTCINVGAGHEHTIAEIATALGRACGNAPDLQDRGEFRVGDIHSCFADLSRASDLLGLPAGNQPGAGDAGVCRVGRSTQESVDLYQQTVEELQRYNLFGRADQSSA